MELLQQQTLVAVAAVVVVPLTEPMVALEL
jgi:hypothetical protein